MSSGIAITVENLSKCYQIYDKPHQRLMQMLWRGRRNYYHEFWALKDVSFTVTKGETVGIIGKNGSGKSTLLQLICGTLNPSAGNIETNGRIAALLELGSGFNPEFTGRENVFLNAAILGLDQEEIKARFDDIAAFADIGEFIDQPVKMYSSGMLVRLAFSVSVNVNPEILVVDEALSVGDEKFVRKCFARLEAIRDSGATILFVSHSGGTIIELCDRAILIDSGERLLTGVPKTVYGHYQRLLYAEADKANTIRVQIREFDRQSLEQPPDLQQIDLGQGHETSPHVDTPKQAASATTGMTPPPEHPEKQGELRDFFDPNLKPATTIAYESRGAIIKEPKITTLNGRPVNHLIRGKWYRYSYRVEFFQDAYSVHFGMLIKTITGAELGGATSAPTMKDRVATVFAGSIYAVNFQFLCLLNTGAYFMNAGVLGEIAGEITYLYRLLDGAMFKVLPESRMTMTGMIDFQCKPGYKIVAS
ncbi:MAG: ABC transporter ATP-binding protein [Desulfobulbaceae bacterium]|jgi:lipopolysaccharide transport system ATP-binding protein|nr:ABC transporter ATP-binding protein [Desulfobulbaceae bacterium]